MTATDYTLITRDLQELSRKVEVTTEAFLNYMDQRITDIPVSVMDCLIEVQKQLELAQKEYNSFVREQNERN